MPETIDDFMNRFGGSGTIDDSEAQQYHDRFVSTNASDRDFDNQTYNKSATEYLGKLPDDQFSGRVAQRIQPSRTAGAAGAARWASRRSRYGVAGGGMGDIANKLGLGTLDPSRMSADDAARLMNYTRSERPELLQKTVEEKPWFVKAIGNPVIMGVLAMAATKLISGQLPKTGGGAKS